MVCCSAGTDARRTKVAYASDVEQCCLCTELLHHTSLKAPLKKITHPRDRFLSALWMVQPFGRHFLMLLPLVAINF